MEADGLEEIEKSDFYVFQAQDYYNNHKNFGYTTRPSSRTYRGLNTHITVTNISKPGITIQAKYAIDFTAPQITANINGGTYYQPFYVTLKSSDLGNIYYTMNNSTPTVLSPKYLNPLKISKTTTLKFFTIDLAGNKSNLYTRKYILN
jgi:hypothetical protein